jgi:hypothetical protein
MRDGHIIQQAAGSTHASKITWILNLLTTSASQYQARRKIDTQAQHTKDTTSAIRFNGNVVRQAPSALSFRSYRTPTWNMLLLTAAMTGCAAGYFPRTLTSIWWRKQKQMEILSAPTSLRLSEYVEVKERFYRLTNATAELMPGFKGPTIIPRSPAIDLR